MRAVACQHGELDLSDLPEPTPGPGQVRLEVLRCGICGSDLHARHGADQWAEMAVKVGYDRFARTDQSIIFGHEFSGRVAEHGPKCRGRVPAGAPVVALPILRSGGVIDTIGLSAHAPGAYAEQLLVQESMMLAVPNGLDPEVAALTEPLAVAWHAVRRGEVKKRDVAIVIGCGPIGLAVILMLKAQGVHTVVASDYAPGRRELAHRCGADVVVDPGTEAPFTAAAEQGGHLTNLPAALELVLDTREKLERLPVGWWHLWRLGEKLGAMPKRPVIFECVGVPGMIEGIVSAAPVASRVVVVGVCMGGDALRPSMAINKEIDLRFVLAYTPLEFRDTLHQLAEGELEVSALVTGTVGLDGVAEAFDVLAGAEGHAKVLVDPSSDLRLGPAPVRTTHAS